MVVDPGDKCVKDVHVRFDESTQYFIQLESIQDVSLVKNKTVDDFTEMMQSIFIQTILLFLSQTKDRDGPIIIPKMFRKDNDQRVTDS